jgi:predicted dehydrogenase
MRSNLPELRAAVIGVGVMGQHHVRVYRDLPGIQLVGVADADDRLREGIVHRYQVPGYADFIALLEETRPDLISVAVPTVLHLQVARAAIERGIHVLIEKPITETVADGATLVELADKHGVVLAVGHIERHNPAVQALKQRLESGQVGPIFELRAERVGPFPDRIRDVGVVLDLATHDIDVICHLAGSPLVRVFAETQQKVHSTREDMVSAILRFANGTTGVLHVNWLTPAKSRRLTVTGARGLYEVDYITQDLTFYENADFGERAGTLSEFEDLQLFRGVSEGRMIRDRIDKREPLRNELEDFVCAVRERRAPQVTGEQGLAVLRIAHAIVTSAERHAVVEIFDDQ